MNIVNKNGLEIYQAQDVGFQSLVHYGEWRVAIATYNEEQEKKHTTKLSRHLKTDEVFVLLNGDCTLYIGGRDKDVTKLDIIKMEPLKVYNITKSTWHGRSLTPGTNILVVENDNTGEHNTESIPLSDSLIMQIKDTP